VGGIDERRSTNKVIFFLDEMQVSWQSQEQRTLALSTCEGEYKADTAEVC
jgi:hypothetical protein